MNAGLMVYNAKCARCHESNGKGQNNIFPPLAKSDYLLKDLNRSIKIVLFGSRKSIKVNGKIYRGKMSGERKLSDQQIADLMNYINHSWGNNGGITTSTMVKSVRESGK
jgi:nitrite reductase (NO-forming)